MSKDCEIKTKMGQEQWLKLKMLFLLGYNLKIVIQWGRIDFWWEGSLLGGGVLGGGEGISKFLAGGVDSPQ